MQCKKARAYNSKFYIASDEPLTRYVNTSIKYTEIVAIIETETTISKFLEKFSISIVLELLVHLPYGFTFCKNEKKNTQQLCQFISNMT